MRTCNTCGQEKELDQFAYRSKAKGTRHYICKECQKLVVKTHYLANKQKYVDKAVTWNKKDARRKHHAHYYYASRKYEACECCTTEQLKQFAINRPIGYHIDHIVDAKDGGKNCLKNLQYLTAREHCKKSQEQAVRSRRGNSNGTK